MPLSISAVSRLAVAASFLLSGFTFAQKVPTTTTLSVTDKSGTAVTSAAKNTPLTLTATVSASGNTTRGAVRFCDAAINAACAGPAILGEGQIRPNGSARIVVRLGYGSHSLKAIYMGINTLASSSSAASSVNVTGAPSATLAVTATGGAANSYTLTGKLAGTFAQRLVPAGPMQFRDATYSNQVVGTAPLSVTAQTFVPNANLGALAFQLPAPGASSSVSNQAPQPVAVVADFNNDGLPEVLFACGGRATSQPCQTGESSGVAVAADIDRDGNLDFIFTDLQTFITSFALGNGDGTFQAARQVAASSAGPMEKAFLVGDFDGDGFLDFAGTSVMWGNGDGTFQADNANGAFTISQPVNTVADLNGDGCADVLTNGHIYFGSPTRKFTQTTTTLSPIAWGDFNNDGKIDLVANGNAFLGNGDGTFQGVSSIGNLLPTSGPLYVGDLNGDGTVDLVAVQVTTKTNGLTYVAQTKVTPYYGNDDGTFRQGLDTLSASTNTALSPSFYVVGAVGDLDQDGLADIAVYGAGSGVVTLSTEWTAEAANVSVAQAGNHEINAFLPANGVFPDLVSSNSSVILGTGSSAEPGTNNGSQATATSLLISAGGSAVTTVSKWTLVSLTATVTSSLSGVTGTVRFCDVTVSTACVGTAMVGSAQVNAAGVAKISRYFAPSVHSLVAQFLGTNTYASSTSTPASLTVTPAASILNLTSTGVQGNYTLTANLSSSFSITPSGMVEFRDTSNGNAVVASAPFASTGPPAIRAQSGAYDATTDTDSLRRDRDGVPQGYVQARGDFNRDGKIDYAAFGAVNLGNGDGTLQPSVTVVGLPYNNVVGDFDGDGFPDIAGASDQANGTNFQTGKLIVVYGKGDGTFGPPVVVENNIGTVQAAADLNGDGISDLLVGYTVWLGKRDRTFMKVTSNPTLNGLVGTFAGLADMNGDGRLDMVQYSTANDTHPLWVLPGAGDGTFGDPIVVTAPAPYTNYYFAGAFGAVVADFDGDGKADVITVRTYFSTRDQASFFQTMDGDARFFSGNGDGTFAAPSTVSVASSFARSGTVFSAQDADGDGLQDAIVSSFTNNSRSTYFNVTRKYSAIATGVSISGIGNHVISAFYAGDSQNAAATSSGTVTLQGGAQTAKLSLSFGTVPSQYGTPVKLTATLSNTGQAASFTDGEVVSFYVGGTQLGTSALSNGTATFTTGILTPGTYNFSASYAGDSKVSAAHGNTPALTISKAPPQIVWPVPPPITYSTALSSTQLNATAVTPEGNALAGTFTYTPAAGAVLDAGTQTLAVHFVPAEPSLYVEADSSVNLIVLKGTATVTLSGTTSVSPGASSDYTVHVSGSGAVPSGIVSFALDGGSISAKNLVNGAATVAYTFNTAGQHTISATYQGDNRYAAGSLARLAVNVQKQQPVIHWSDPAAISYGTPLSSVQLNATATTSGGQAVAGNFTYTPTAGATLATGTQALNVLFTPSDTGTYETATKSVSIVVNKAPSNTTIVQTAPTSLGVGTSTSTTFTVTVSSPLGTPSGQVTFFDGTTQLGTAALAGGRAQLTTSFSTVGNHPITATYSGDSTFLGSTSSVFNEVVVSPSLSVTASPSAMTIHQGGTGTSTITLTPIGNYTGKVDFACSNLPALATCAFSPSTLVLNGDNTVQTTTLTVQTRGPGVGALRNRERAGIQLAGLMALPFLLFGFARGRHSRLSSLLSLLVLVVLAGAMSGCGSPANVTPTGTTSMQVTAQATAGSGPAQTQSLKINITIVQ